MGGNAIRLYRFDQGIGDGRVLGHLQPLRLEHVHELAADVQASQGLRSGVRCSCPNRQSWIRNRV